MTTNLSPLSHPILTPDDRYEKHDIEKLGFPDQYDSQTIPPLIAQEDSLPVEHQPSLSKTRPIRRLMGFLKRRKAPAAKMDALQAEQERELVEEMDEHWTMAFYAVAALSVSTALFAMSKHSDNSIIKAAFLFPLITAPYAVAQRRQLKKAAFLREDCARLKSRMKRLRQQNQGLQHQSKHLDCRLSSLKVADRDLGAILKKQGGSRRQVQSLVRENGEIMRETIQLQESKALLQIVKLHSDDKGGLHLDDRALKELIQRMQNMSPRTLDEHKLRKALGKTTSLVGVSSLGSDALEESEYEAFSFPRTHSMEH